VEREKAKHGTKKNEKSPLLVIHSYVKRDTVNAIRTLLLSRVKIVTMVLISLGTILPRIPDYLTPLAHDDGATKRQDDATMYGMHRRPCIGDITYVSFKSAKQDFLFVLHHASYQNQNHTNNSTCPYIVFYNTRFSLHLVRPRLYRD
jgi:hypothetical protein